MDARALMLMLAWETDGFTPTDIFANGEPGVWYDPSDFSTMFQDSAGTVPVTAVEQPVGLMLDKSGNGNHAYQTTATSRPVLSARVNQYLATETLATQNVTTLAAQYRLSFEGTGTVTLSGTATGVYSAGSHLITCTAGTLTSTVSGSVTKADLRVANDGANLPLYQRVNTTTDYDTVGFPHYLRFDGVNDWLVTNTITITPETDKVQVFAGVRKLSDAVGFGMLAELGVAGVSGPGRFNITVPATAGTATYFFASGGTVFPSSGVSAIASGYVSPITNVLAAVAEINQRVMRLRVNGTQAASSTTNQGSGNFLAYPLYIGRRGGTTLPFNGRLYSLIVRFGNNLPIETIEQSEAWINGKTGAY